MIRILKYFFIIFILSYTVVWVSDHPGTIKIFGQEYLIETNIIELFFFILVIFLVFFFILELFQMLKIYRFISGRRREKIFF